MELEWMDPPAIKQRKSKSQQVLDALKKNPGVWARVEKGKKSGGAQSNWKKLGCEAISRADPTAEKRWDVYARWPVEPQAAPAKTSKSPVAAAPASAGVLAKPEPVAPEVAKKPRWPEKTELDPDDPNDQYLARQRVKLEADRAARLAKAARVAEYAQSR